MSTAPRRLATVRQTAAYLHRHERTVRLWTSRDYFTLYTMPGVRGVLFDLDEIDRELPRLMAEGKILGDRFGGRPVVQLVPAAQPSGQVQ